VHVERYVEDRCCGNAFVPGTRQGNDATRRKPSIRDLGNGSRYQPHGAAASAFGITRLISHGMIVQSIAYYDAFGYIPRGAS